MLNRSYSGLGIVRQEITSKTFVTQFAIGLVLQEFLLNLVGW